MLRFRQIIACGSPIVVLLFLSGCEFTYTNNSSQRDNEYFEEPLSDSSEEFRAALELSNEVVDALVDGKFSSVRGLLVEDLAAVVSEERLAEVYGGFLKKSGPYQEHLPMQWGFTRLTEDGEEVVYSTKIVIHENYRAFYHFKFANDGKFDELLEMHFFSEVGTEKVSQAVTKAIEAD